MTKRDFMLKYATPDIQTKEGVANFFAKHSGYGRGEAPEMEKIK